MRQLQLAKWETVEILLQNSKNLISVGTPAVSSLVFFSQSGTKPLMQ